MRVVGHVLCLERGDSDVMVGQEAAQTGCDHGFTNVAPGSQDGE